MGSTCVEARWFRRENLWWDVVPVTKKDKDVALWGCTGSHRAEDSPGVSDLLKVILWLCSRFRTGMSGILIYNVGELPLRIGGGNAHNAHCSVPHRVSAQHTCAAVCVLVHEIQSVYNQQTRTVHQGPAVCFIHLFNRHLLTELLCARHYSGNWE